MADEQPLFTILPQPPDNPGALLQFECQVCPDKPTFTTTDVANHAAQVHLKRSYVVDTRALLRGSKR